MTPVPPRASPDALLTLADKAERGRLKIFLGASPGVGKTYAMLQAARAAHEEGRDVVIGVIETHGRRETEALLENMAVLPRAAARYRGRAMMEFDIDAALARRPQLLLVDEYAHTNVPGSRHPKRWQDVEELLAAGINVWTTLNIQHLESLNDVILRITGVRVRETVPDTVFENADDVMLVDITPDELIKRMHDGKVYMKDTAAKAVNHFFKPNNLLALRELMMRRAAERIDSDLVENMQRGAIEGPWAAGERILVCVGPDSASLFAVRQAKRLADLIGAPWLAVTIEQPATMAEDKGSRATREALSLAESLGAEIKTLVGNDFPAEILRHARFENATQIVVGRPARRFFRRSLADQLVRQAAGISIQVITPEYQPYRHRFGLSIAPLPQKFWPFASATLAVSLVVWVGHLFALHRVFPNISLLFVLVVLFSAIRHGIWAACYASIVSFLAYNYFFIAPLYTFSIARPHEVLSLMVFLLTAFITSALAGRSREQMQQAVNRVRSTRRLYEFSRKMGGLVGGAIPEGAAAEIHSTLHLPSVILTDDPAGLTVMGSWPPIDALDAGSTGAARWCFERSEQAGWGTMTLPTIPWLFLPIRTKDITFGVLGVIPDMNGLDNEARAMLEVLAEQTALAMYRDRLDVEMTTAKAEVEIERVRNVLLSSISHDFRTPLSSILGASTSLLAYKHKLEPAQSDDLLLQIQEEAQHLDRLVRNLLSMTRLEAGALDLKFDWIDLRELSERAFSVLRKRGVKRNFTLESPENLPLVRGDAVLLDQVLANILENAIKYTALNGKIRITLDAQPHAVCIRIADDGIGIPPDLLPQVFEKFTRRTGDSNDGAGLGLAIAKGIVLAHEGTLVAHSPITRNKGCAITITLPVPAG